MTELENCLLCIVQIWTCPKRKEGPFHKWKARGKMNKTQKKGGSCVRVCMTVGLCGCVYDSGAETSVPKKNEGAEGKHVEAGIQTLHSWVEQQDNHHYAAAAFVTRSGRWASWPNDRRGLAGPTGGRGERSRCQRA